VFVNFTETARRGGGRVLVHCRAGVSRSATICIAYLMVHRGLSLDEAFDFVQARRQIIAPNMNFMQQLWELERVLLVTRVHSQGLNSPKALTPRTCAHVAERSPALAKSTSFSFNGVRAVTHM